MSLQLKQDKDTFEIQSYKKKEIRKKNLTNDKFSEISFKITKLIVNMVLVSQNKE